VERFKTTPDEAWRVLPSLCNARYKNGIANALEGVFKCEVVGATIGLYTDR